MLNLVSTDERIRPVALQSQSNGPTFSGADFLRMPTLHRLLSLAGTGKIYRCGTDADGGAQGHDRAGIH